VAARYQYFRDEHDVPHLLTALSARTVVLDIEPFVAIWNGAQDALDLGVSRTLEQMASVPGVRAVCFATNSARRPSALPGAPGIDVSYIVNAGKPVHLAAYERLPQPGVVVGDQLMTDGLLARRLGYAFLHYRPAERAPTGPWLLDLAGRLARPLIFPS
jgi:predicted HAD superfamily phosphohydrolase YqeG